MSGTLLVTGSAGLVGSAVVSHFCALGWDVVGVDNNARADFFGPEADTRWNTARLLEAHRRFRHVALDVRDRAGVLALIQEYSPAAIVHAAAQPSHDLAARRPLDDFDVNAVGTLNLLESVRRTCPESPFVFLSSNKVYGDAPNRIAMRETDTRFEYADPRYADGITEDFGVDQSMHSLFGASKLAADVLVQEYGRYFEMPTCCLRGGCLTGATHSGVELHGFLSYLVRCNVERGHYRVYGHQGKQVRDNLDARDVARFIEQFVAAPRCAEVYNLGGGTANAISIREAFETIAAISATPMRWDYVDEARAGDHVCYVSDLSKIRSHYPGWEVTVDLAAIFEALHRGWLARAPGVHGQKS